MFNTTRRVLQSLVFMLLMSLPTLIYAQEVSIVRNTKGAWSPDGRYLGVITKDGSTRLLDTLNNTETLLHFQPDGYESGEDVTITWNPDGTMVAVTAEYSGIVVLEVATGQRLWNFIGYRSRATSWSPDGTRLAILTRRINKELHIFDTTTWDIIAVASVGVYNFDMAWSPDGQKIALGVQDFVEVRDAATLGVLYRSNCQCNVFLEISVAWSPDSSRIASANSNGSLRIRNAADGAIEQVWAAHEDGAYSVAWHPDGTRLVSGGADGTVKVWAAASGQLLQTIQVGQPVWWAAWSPDGGRLAYGTEAGTPQIISVVPTATPTLPPTDLRALYAA